MAAPKLLAFGSSGDDQVISSAGAVTVRSQTDGEWTVARSDSFILVTDGSANLHAEDGTAVVVQAGQGVLVPKGAKTRWAWAGAGAYVTICVPALWMRLRALHEEARHEFVYHCAPRARWEAALASGASHYFPETFEKEQFVHATADPAVLLSVLNHFYKSSIGDWVCLRMTVASLLQHGVQTIFEPAAPVGETMASTDPAISSVQLFPHLQGGIPPSAVLEVTPVLRASDGTFVQVAGVTANAGSASRVGALAASLNSSFAAGLALGAAGAGLLALALASRARP